MVTRPKKSSARRKKGLSGKRKPETFTTEVKIMYHEKQFYKGSKSYDKAHTCR